MNKILITREILMAMEFLNIPSDRFKDMKEKCGGLYSLYTYIGNKL